MMKVINENNEFKISIPVNLVDITEIQDFLDYLKFRSITSKSKATEKDIEDLSNEINQSWWDKNKDKYLE